MKIERFEYNFCFSSVEEVFFDDFYKVFDLVIIRGVSGSGKSTLAKTIAGDKMLVFEADMYFVVEGKYCFDATKLSNAHRWCIAQVLHSLEDGKRVIVSNTCTQPFEIEPYANFCESNPHIHVAIIDLMTQHGNVHGVPEEQVDRQRKRFVPAPALPNLKKFPNVTTCRIGCAN